MANIVICGWYGNENLGDELILESMLHQFQSIFEDSSITVFSDNPNETKSKYGVNSVRRKGNAFHRLQRAIAVSKADLYVLGGGGILMDYGKARNIVLRWLEEMKLAQQLGIPNMAFSVGVGKIWIDESKQSILEVLPRADAICVRDKESAETLAKLGVSNLQITSDIALIHPELLHARMDTNIAKRASSSIIVCLRHWFDTSNSIDDPVVFDRLIQSLASFLSEMSTSRMSSITFAPLRTRSADDDRVVAQKVVKLMDDKRNVTIIDHSLEPSEFFDLVLSSELLIGMRLHSLIAAAAIGVPCIAINYSPKVRSFMSSIGADSWVLEPSEVSPERLREISADLLRNNGLPPRVSELIQKRKKEATKNTSVAKMLVMQRSAKRKSSFFLLVSHFVIENAKRIFSSLMI